MPGTPARIDNAGYAMLELFAQANGVTRDALMATLGMQLVAPDSEANPVIAAWVSSLKADAEKRVRTRIGRTGPYTSTSRTEVKINTTPAQHGAWEEFRTSSQLTWKPNPGATLSMMKTRLSAHDPESGERDRGNVAIDLCNPPDWIQPEVLTWLTQWVARAKEQLSE